MLQSYTFSFGPKCFAFTKTAFSFGVCGVCPTFAVEMTIGKTANNILKVSLSLLLGGAILYWMYRNFDFSKIGYVLLHEMDWTWMLLSLPFGVLAEAVRGWRWLQTLEPVGEHPRASVAVNSVFLSYALSLLIPRVGEFARCGVLRQWDGVSFPKALGTVVTERAIDAVLLLVITGIAFLTGWSTFSSFFGRTGTRIDELTARFTTAGWWVTAICVVAALALIYVLLRRMSFFSHIKQAFRSLLSGVISVKYVKNVPLFIALTLAIWASYFLHYYLTFFCFDETAGLGIGCALVTFIVGTMAVIVPTPNGAGPWHFAVKTMLILYGVSQTTALYFVLIVHAVQTLLVLLLGIYAWVALSLTRRVKSDNKNKKP